MKTSYAIFNVKMENVVRLARYKNDGFAFILQNMFFMSVDFML